MGYVLKPGLMLPPLMFSKEEIEALVLGSRWVADRGDARAGRGRRATCWRRSAQCCPPICVTSCDSSTMLVGPGARSQPGISELRRSVAPSGAQTQARDHVTGILKGDETLRAVIWPFALGFFDRRARASVSWCELRQAIRHFRTDRIVALAVSKTGLSRARGSAAAQRVAREIQRVPAGLIGYCDFLTVDSEHAARFRNNARSDPCSSPNFVHPLRRQPARRARDFYARAARPRAGRSSADVRDVRARRRRHASDCGRGTRRRRRSRRATRPGGSQES